MVVFTHFSNSCFYCFQVPIKSCDGPYFIRSQLNPLGCPNGAYMIRDRRKRCLPSIRYVLLLLIAGLRLAETNEVCSHQYWFIHVGSAILNYQNSTSNAWTFKNGTLIRASMYPLYGTSSPFAASILMLKSFKGCNSGIGSS